MMYATLIAITPEPITGRENKPIFRRPAKTGRLGELNMTNLKCDNCGFCVNIMMIVIKKTI